MDQVAVSWQRVRGWPARRGVELRLSLRMIVAAVLAFACAHLLALPQDYWAVLTAVIVMQSSVGGSLKATLDWLAVTIVGTAYGAAIALLAPHDSPLGLGAVLAIALAPLTLLVALRPSFRVAPIIVIIMLLGGAQMHIGPIASATARISGIMLGSLVGIGVALLVLPARAHGLVAVAAGRTLGLLAELAPTVIDGLTRETDAAARQHLLDRVLTSLVGLAAIADEAERERRSHLSDAVNPQSLVRTLRRLSNDLVTVRRTATEPLPEASGGPLAPALAAVSTAVTDLLRDTGAALAVRRPPPPLDAVDDAFDGFAAAMAAVRRDRPADDRPVAAMDRLFALEFAFERLHRDLKDLGGRAAELVQRR